MSTPKIELEIVDLLSGADPGKLAWSEGSHRGSGDVVYVAQDPPPSLRHGSYQIHRGEGGIRLSYERWRDEHGGAVPIQHERLGEFSSLPDAKAAASRHHDDARRRQGAIAAVRVPSRPPGRHLDGGSPDPTRGAYPQDLLPGDLVMRRDVRGRKKYRVSHTGSSGQHVQVYAREVGDGSGRIVTFDRSQLRTA